MQSYDFDYMFRAEEVSVHVDYERCGYKNAELTLKTNFVFKNRKLKLSEIVLHWVPEELSEERILKKIRAAVEKNINIHLIYTLDYENRKRMDKAMRQLIGKEWRPSGRKRHR